MISCFIFWAYIISTFHTFTKIYNSENFLYTSNNFIEQLLKPSLSCFCWVFFKLVLSVVCMNTFFYIISLSYDKKAFFWVIANLIPIIVMVYIYLYQQPSTSIPVYLNLGFFASAGTTGCYFCIFSKSLEA